MYRPRKPAHFLTRLLLSLLAGAALSATCVVDLFLVPQLPDTDPLTFSVRVPNAAVYQDTITEGASFRVRRLTRGRHETLADQDRRLVQAYEKNRRPLKPPLLIGLMLAGALLFVILGSYLGVLGGEVALARTQLMLTLLILVFAAGCKAMLMFSSWSPLWAPLLAVTIPVGMQLGRRVAGATAVASAVAVGLLTPIDLLALVVLSGQGLSAAFALRPGRGVAGVMVGAIAGALGGLLCYAAISLMQQQYIPIDLNLSLNHLAHSDIIATGGGAIAGGLLASLWTPLGRRLLGNIPRQKLAELTDFEHPLLKRLATRAPGTWAHSLNLANMAEMAANAIGARAQLVRVGAYYHDVGKSEQPEYFIENQSGKNPHDAIPPEVSVDAIFAHVTAGVSLARKHGLPRRIIEFIYTHHGTERLEYFWQKHLKRVPDPDKESDRDYRYPGVAPQTREEGILSICDAVEAASKTLTSPGLEDIKRLVRQICAVKLESGSLDQSGLSVDDLRRVTDSLIEYLRSALHVRVKYPWQKDSPDEKRESPKRASKANKKRKSGGQIAIEDSDENASSPIELSNDMSRTIPHQPSRHSKRQQSAGGAPQRPVEISLAKNVATQRRPSSRTRPIGIRHEEVDDT